VIVIIRKQVVLGDVMFIVFAIVPKVLEFEPGRQQWIFKVDKVRSTISFGEEVKLSARVTAC
jgi:hypothetical protein